MKDPLPKVLQFTPHIEGVIKIFKENIDLLQHRAVIIRFTKFIKKLKQKDNMAQMMKKKARISCPYQSI